LGGFAVTLAEMCMGGDLGVNVDLKSLGNAPGDVKLFSESNTRWVVEARDAVAFEGHMRAAGVPIQRIGLVEGRDIKITDGARRLLTVSVEDARREHTEAFQRRMA
jgi:phosphoribosylformylglycinamidine synthase